MINARFEIVPEKDEIISLRVTGHAGFDSYGYDIVCASVSALVISTINALEDYVGLNTNVQINEDYTSFSVTAIDEYTSVQAQTLMHSLEMGIRALSEEYDDFIKVDIVEVEKNDQIYD